MLKPEAICKHLLLKTLFSIYFCCLWECVIEIKRCDPPVVSSLMHSHHGPFDSKAELSCRINKQWLETWTIFVQDSHYASSLSVVWSVECGVTSRSVRSVLEEGETDTHVPLSSRRRGRGRGQIKVDIDDVILAPLSRPPWWTDTTRKASCRVYPARTAHRSSWRGIVAPSTSCLLAVSPVPSSPPLALASTLVVVEKKIKGETETEDLSGCIEDE